MSHENVLRTAYTCSVLVLVISKSFPGKQTSRRRKREREGGWGREAETERKRHTERDIF